MIDARIARIFCLLLPAAAYSADPVFDAKVVPVLKSRCLPCHDGASRTSGLSVLDRSNLLQGGARFGPSVSAGKPEDSVLIKMIRGDIKPRMPMGGVPLTADEIKGIEDWIRGVKPENPGATASRWWAFQPVLKPVPPPVKDLGRVKNSIDPFIQAALEARKIAPAAEAERVVLLRRLYFDLIGLPPTPAEGKAFLNDRSPGAYEKLVDRLLADVRFGERWGRYWLDLARYADTDGFEGDMERPHMWRYRDYVVDSMNSDKPYDRFIREQIAGDELAATNPDGPVGAGFLRLAAWHPIGVAAEARQALLSEMTSAVGAVFLGLTVKCAQCHDHKYDPIPQKDFFRMQTFFVPVEFTDQKLGFREARLGGRMEPGRAEAARRLKEAEARFADYERELLPKLDEIVKEERGPAAQATGKALFSRLVRNDAGTMSIAAEPKFTSAEKKKFLDLYSDIDPGAVKTLRDSGKARRQLARFEPVIHTVRNTTAAGGPPKNHVRLGGDYDRLGETVSSGFPSAVDWKESEGDEGAPGRTRLANWVADPVNPLTTRVMVNRIWQQIFGVGIVSTPSDFGKNGARPSNPLLLDWLATEFVRKNWSIKSMVRTMVTSATYRQASLVSSPEAERIDPSNSLLWRMNRKRMEGEAIRDSFLFVSGQLNPERGGPGVFPELPGNLAEVTIKNKQIWEPSHGPETKMRSIYVFQRRQLELPFLSLLDAPVPNFSCERRIVSTTAVQALTLMNDRFSHDNADAFARRVRTETGLDLTEQIQHAFRLALSRNPSRDEMRKAVAFVSQQGNGGLEAFCRVLMNTNEFVYVN